LTVEGLHVAGNGDGLRRLRRDRARGVEAEGELGAGAT
jgi:hypothetical protein